MTFNAPNINHLWASLIVEELVRNGVHLFCLSPGSRSTPLTTAVAAHPEARAVMHFDERGTAFLALGYGRATGRPAAWITTSGTAVANGFPAVVEASVDSVPMILLTSDRPPELRQTGANQTIDQVKLFGSYPRWTFDMPTPSRDLDPAMVLTTVDQALYRARGIPAGPVHLNCMFREPLAPDRDGPSYDSSPASLVGWAEGEEPYTQYASSRVLPGDAALTAWGRRFREVARGLVLVGSLRTLEDAAAVEALAARLGWPLLPDVTSQLRLGGGTHITYYDQLLGSASFRERYRPEAVLHLGGRFTSKRLSQYIEVCRPRLHVVVNDTPFRLDPAHQVTHRIHADIHSFCNTLTGRIDAAADREEERAAWCAAWQSAGAAAVTTLGAYFEEEELLTEPLVARLLTQHIAEGQGLVVANSMPVRDVDMYATAGGQRVQVVANRGASGIDGLVATAAGVYEGLGRPVTLLIGDLALLHDLNSLALLRERRVVVVVVNNDGGGIFHFLPIAAHPDVFEPYFGTPHGLSFSDAAALFGLAYQQVQTRDALIGAYQKALRNTGSSLIEVKTDRAANHALHQRLLEDVAKAVTLLA